MRKGTSEDAVNYWERMGAMLVCSLTHHPLLLQNKDHPNILSNQGVSFFVTIVSVYGVRSKNRKNNHDVYIALIPSMK